VAAAATVVAAAMLGSRLLRLLLLGANVDVFVVRERESEERLLHVLSPAAESSWRVNQQWQHLRRN